MKKTFTIAFLFFFSFSLFAIIPPKFTSENFQIKGSAKSLTLKVYKAIDKYYTVEVGDLMGLVSSLTYEDGNLKSIYEFNNQGAVEFWFEIEFDKKGNLQSEKKYSGIGALSSYSQVKSGSNKRISQRDVFKNNGGQVYSDLFVYDKKGNLIEEKKVHSREGVASKIIYTYDTVNCLVSQTQYKNDIHMQFKDVFEYEDNQKVVEERYGRDDDLISRKLFKYDEKGNVIWTRKIAPNTQDTEMAFRYEFDSKGNWIKKVCYQNRIFPAFIVFREIIY